MNLHAMVRDLLAEAASFDKNNVCGDPCNEVLRRRGRYSQEDQDGFLMVRGVEAIRRVMKENEDFRELVLARSRADEDYACFLEAVYIHP